MVSIIRGSWDDLKVLARRALNSWGFTPEFGLVTWRVHSPIIRTTLRLCFLWAYRVKSVVSKLAVMER